MENVWYIGFVVDYDKNLWDIVGVFPNKDSAIDNLKEGEFCSKIKFGVRVPEDVKYSDESYWKLNNKIVPSESNTK